MNENNLKNCPNCGERIGIHDIECPYCKYIDDPKYKKHNQKVIKNGKKKARKKKNDIYKVILLVPIICYLVGLIFKIDLFKIIFPLILLNVMCLFVKKSLVIGVIGIELLIFCFSLISKMDDSFIILLIGIMFVIIPKVIYVLKVKKKKKIRK